MAIQTTLPADGWVPRWYQFSYWKYRRAGGKRAVLVLPRRHGKDHLCLNDMAFSALTERVGSYYYVMPYQMQARRIIWNGIDKGGRKFMDAFPRELVERKSDAEMRLHLKNGSIFQLVGGDDPDKLVGANPVGVVFSEFSLTNPLCWKLIAPILAENEGWATFNGTPRGKNHFWRMHLDAQARSDRWFHQYQNAADLRVLTKEQIRELRDELKDEALFQQEVFCSFESPLQGAYFATQFKFIDRNKRVASVPIEPRAPVHTAWDLGVDDSTAIWFFQTIGREIRIIHYLENSGEGLPYYATQLKEFSDRTLCVYGEHYAPHDINFREIGTGRSRIETAKSLGIRFRPVKKLAKADAIEACRNVFPSCYFDSDSTERGVDCLRNYRKKWDETRMVFQNQPLHDWASHGADAFQTLAVGLGRSIDKQDTEKKEVAVYGDGDYNPADH